MFARENEIVIVLFEQSEMTKFYSLLLTVLEV